MLDLTLWAPVDCICPALCSDPDGFCMKVLTFAAEGDMPTKDRTLNLMLNYAPVMS